MKKNIKVIGIILILLFTQFAPIVYAQEDTTPPSILEVFKDKTVLKVGETLKFNIKVEDDFSGVGSIYIQWTLKKDDTKSISKQYYDIENVKEYEYLVPDNTLAGEWQAVYISINDNASNYKFYNRYDSEEILSKFDFTVEDTNQDTEAPIVTNVRKITTNFDAPGDVIIQYDVMDSGSGVKQNYGGVGYSPINNRDHETGINPKKIEENTYQAIIHIDSKYEAYIFKYIQVSDNAGNWKNYTYEDLGLTNELDIIPNNYEEDKNAPKLLSYEYNKNKIQIPSYLETTFNIEENESGLGSSIGKAYFKSNDGKYDKEFGISKAVDANGLVQDNKGSVRIDFNNEETYRGEIYLYKVTLKDSAGNERTYSIENGNLDKREVTISKIEKSYTLTTSTAKEGYVNEISALPEGSTVLCNVLRGNQIIKKELFDAIKGKDITITFMSIYNSNWQITGTAGSITTNDTDTGIQWIINGKDITNEIKDVDMTIKMEKKRYSKYIVPGYEINENLEIDFWNSVDTSNMTDEEIQNKGKELVELQKVELKKYFDSLKRDGYTNLDKVYENALALIEENIGADCKCAIIDTNDYIEYLSIEFAQNGVLPCKTLIRIKPEYAARAIFGSKDLNLYYANGDNYDLIENNIKIDDEDYYNFTLTHNSEYWLTSGQVSKLEKTNNNSDNESINNPSNNGETNSPSNVEENENKTTNPKTGDNIAIYVGMLIISLLGICVIIKKNFKK